MWQVFSVLNRAHREVLAGGGGIPTWGALVAGGAAGLAIMLGADLGSAIVVQILTSPISALTPLLLHLLFRRRYRRVRWAAMEFLLQSYKKHRKWVWLKQLLLLLSRMAAVSLLVGGPLKQVLRDGHLELLADLLKQAGADGKARPEEFTRYGSARKLYTFNIDNADAY